MKTVIRHSLAVRLTHWTIAISGILLLFSGFGQLPMYKRYNLVKVPGFSWSDDFEKTLLIHYIAAIFFTAATFFHFVYHWRRREFSIVPQKGDLINAVKGFLSMVGIGQEPRNDKFQAKQRVVYVIFSSVGMVLILTGLVKSFKNTGDIILDPIFLQWMAFIHTIVGMVFLLLFLVHVLIFFVKAYRPMVPAMITGRISEEYARHHHPDWDIDQESRTEES